MSGQPRREPAGPPTREATHDGIVQIIQLVAQRALEVERGLRPPAHLEQLLDRRTFRQWNARRGRGAHAGGPVVERDLGPVHLTRSGHRVIANLTVRIEPDRWAAVSITLARTGTRWRVADLHRLLARGTETAPPSVDPPSFPTLAVQTRRVREVRRDASAALEACTRRLADFPANDPARAELTRLRDYWQAVVAEHDRELAGLGRRLQLRRAIEALPRNAR